MTMDHLDLEALGSRVVRVSAEVAAIDTHLRALVGAVTPARASLEHLTAGSPGADIAHELESLDGDLAALEADVREGFAAVETQVAEVAAALRALQERVDECRAHRTQAEQALQARMTEVHGQIDDVVQRLEHAGADGTSGLRDLARSVREDRHHLEQSVASLRDAAQSTGASAGQRAERTRHHSDEVARALESELGTIGRLLAQVADRLQHDVEAALDREVQAVVREAVERSLRLFEEQLGRIRGDRDDLRGVREVLSSLFERLSSLVGPLESETHRVHERHSELEHRADEKRRRDEEERRRREDEEERSLQRELHDNDGEFDDV